MGELRNKPNPAARRGDSRPRPCRLDPDGHARRVLEFDKLLEFVAAEARSAGGRRLVLDTVPEIDAAQIQACHARLGEVRGAFDDGLQMWPLDGIHDLSTLVDVAERGSTLGGGELREVAETLHTAQRMRRFLDQHAARFERLRQTVADLREHAELVQAIHKAVLENGELSDIASPELARIRRGLLQQRTKILAKLERHLEAGSSSGGAGDGDDAYVTLRAERYVIPVRADSGKIDGIVHDRSGSGATLFVEPLDVVEANNELQALRDAEVREIQRVLQALTGQVASSAASIRAAQTALEQLDAVHAAGRAAVAMEATTPGAHAAPHTTRDHRTMLRLRGARHPLLESRLRERDVQIVPLDLDVSDARALVITGPNTGGKTVVLKTLGLLVLMHQSGFQIPAHTDSELPIFTRLIANIGDEQSIESAESTFSSHLRHVRGALEAAQPGQLVLLDEFMAGTDPEEGAALAKAVLRRLVARGATVFVTSHLGALKLFAHAEPGLANASMLFDPERRVPLFRMQTGVPGSSNAFATAERMGFDAELLDEARRERGEEAGRVESVLQALEEERRRLETAREGAELADVEAKRIREEAATELGQLTRKRNEWLGAARREAADVVSRAQARIEATIRELREAQATRDAIRATREEMEALRDELGRDAAAEWSGALGPASGSGAAHRDAGAPEDRPPQAGDTVWIRSLQREGQLETVLDDGRASVRYGNAEIMLHVKDLELRSIPGRSEPQRARGAPGPSGAGSNISPPIGGADFDAGDLESLEIHVRGMDREDALVEVDRFLDRAVLQNAPMARIVHGKGEGILRRAVHDFLRQHPRVADYRLGEHGEGGYGVTIVTLH